MLLLVTSWSFHGEESLEAKLAARHDAAGVSRAGQDDHGTAGFLTTTLHTLTHTQQSMKRHTSMSYLGGRCCLVSQGAAEREMWRMLST